ncbi:MAG TPA: tRNA pseudouridine(55) synthase TruB [Dermatophilaceae bacterium]|nr:tRNA pseudouridine(55) synthase TruB [Dermatophilaceae bacterium]
MSPAPAGILLVDKPAGWTSHDVVARARRLCGTRRVGHAGTLDPMATGVLVLGVERGTRLLTFLVGCDKDYTATVRLGQATVTDDAEGEVTAAPGAGAAVTRERLAEAVRALTGDIEQVPSAVSAIKVNGRRAYHRVRSGEQVELAARRVTVSRFEVGDARRTTAADGTEVLDVDVEVTVSSGTYVRALARDLGAALGTGGHLSALRRTRVGGFGIGQAATLDELAAIEPERLPVVPLADAARATLPIRALTAEEAQRLGQGQAVASQEPGRTGLVAAIAPDGTLVAVVDETGERARSRVVFAPAAS